MWGDVMRDVNFGGYFCGNYGDGLLGFAPGAFGGPPKSLFFDWLKRTRIQSRKI